MKGRARALLIPTAVGLIGLIAASPAPAASLPLPFDSGSPLTRHHLGYNVGSVHASAHSARALQSTGSRVHLFRCDEAPGGRCGIIRVPLDRAHPRRGSVPIFFAYFRHRGPGPTKRAILTTEGGPGGSITQGSSIGPLFLDAFGPLLRSRDLILLDQRGVGRSGAIDCEQAQHDFDWSSPRIYRNVRACGRQLGPAASLYGSGDVALDINAVRRALGIKKLDLYGRSYAGVDVQSYAARFPRHVRSAVLDTPMVTGTFNAPGSEFDDVRTDIARAVPRVADLLCARSASCSAERQTARGDLAWLARRLRHRALDGTGYDAQGTPHQVRVTEGFLAWIILQAEDSNFTSLSEIGAAADALRAGDRVPLLRLAAEGDAANAANADGGDPTAFSVGDNFARACTDLAFSWDEDSPISTRLRQWQRARNALPPDRFGLFSVEGWLARPTSRVAPDPCIVWPAPRRRVPPPIPPGAKLPGRVPALVLAGDLDFGFPRSPADSKSLTHLWPHSDYVELANSGHLAADSARSDCADLIIMHFIAKLRPGDTSCARNADAVSFPGVGRFALTAKHARPAGITPGSQDRSRKLDRRVATVATGAITDALRRAILQPEPSNGVGLRGGTFDAPSFDDAGATVELHDARFARDVAVTGTDKYLFQKQSIDARVRVDGPCGEDGTLHVTGVWFGVGVPSTVLRIRGSLADRRVALLAPAT
jgi:pimeloyl-ACP methyl ester carboxylesterase